MPSTSQSLVLYTRQPLATTTASSLVARSLFTQQTGTAIATELLYRILLEILNRVLVGVQGFAAKRLDDLHVYLEKRGAERAMLKGVEDKDKGEGELRVVEEVGKVAGARGFACPLTGGEMGERCAEGGWKGRRGPPEWVMRRWEGKIGEGPWARLRNAEEGRVGSDGWVEGLAA